MGKIKISVVVCTHNRADLLRHALDSLVRQTLSDNLYEIIVVDNHSTDGTQSVIAEFQRIHPTSQIVMAYEPDLGLAHARNTGWSQARGGYVAFMDDDAKADEHWLEYAVECFERAMPIPLVAGGPIFPYYPSPKPGWFKDEYELRSWGDKPRPLNHGESFSGSNMIFQKKTLENFGGFDVRVGMKGNRISVGEETALFQKIFESADAPDSLYLYYSPQLVVYHAVGANKMRASYHLNRAFATGQVWYLMNGPKALRERMRFLRMTLGAIRRLSASALEQFRKFPDYRNWMVESLGPVALELGRLMGGLGAWVSVWQGKSQAGAHAGGAQVRQTD